MIASSSSVLEREENKFEWASTFLDNPFFLYGAHALEEDVKRGIIFFFNLEPTLYGYLQNIYISEIETNTTGIISQSIGYEQISDAMSRVVFRKISSCIFKHEGHSGVSDYISNVNSGVRKAEERQSKELFERLYTLMQYGEYNTDEVSGDTIEINLREAIRQGGRLAIHYLDNLISSKIGQPELVFDVLRLIGRIKDRGTHQSRLRLLEKQLTHSSRWIRDGAALGLASLEDNSSLPALIEAVEREGIPDLKKDLQRVVKHLELLDL